MVDYGKLLWFMLFLLCPVSVLSNNFLQNAFDLQNTF